ncbi:MAG: tetratricopeptide repeat protein [Armatimonadetes bacterium]|nr:tetratricopeptide repeat protein [Armatimonadota bacterium]
MKTTHRTLQCRSCEATHTLDSKFCRACGQAFAPEDIEEAKEKNLELVQAGMKSLTEGRVAEAILVAQSALSADPSSIEAWALLGESREKNGDYPAALVAFRKLVEIDPNSPIYPIKVQHLEDLIDAETLAVVKPANRKVALMGGIAATALVACVGSLIALAMQKQTPAPETGKPDLLASNQSNPAANQSPIILQTNQPQATPQTQPGVESERKIEPTAKPDETVNRKPILPEGKTSNQLPRPDTEGDYSPINPNVKVEPAPQPVMNTTTSSPTRVAGGTVDEDPSGGVATAPPKNEPKVKPIRPPVYDIKVTSGHSSGATSGGTPAKSSFKLGQDAFLAGNMTDAAAYFEQARNGSASQGKTNQRLGQCYERLGRKADAVQAYERAIAAYQKEGGNDAALESCRRALAVLRS